MDKVRSLGSQILYLKKTTKKKNNLLKYFQVKLKKDTSIREQYVKEILESISTLEEDSFSILENGISKVDVLNSIADSSYQQCYIGYLKRI